MRGTLGCEIFISMKSLTAGLSGKMLSSSAKGGENVLARGWKDRDFEVEGEVGKVIL